MNLCRGQRKSVLRWEFRRLAFIQKRRRRLHRFVRSFCWKIASAHPLYDISAVIWLAFVSFLPTGGYNFLWTCVSNVSIAWLLNMVIASRYPAEMERRLRSSGHVSPHALPPVDIWMAVVVGLSIYRLYPSTATFLGPLAYIALLLGCRVYACTYFFHQLLAGLVGGGIGAWATHKLGRMFFRRVPYHIHAALTVIIVLAVLCYLGYRAERQESPVLRVPKADYLEVLENIFNSDEAKIPPPRLSKAERRRESLEHAREERKDSFGVLMETLERRAYSQALAEETDSRSTRSSVRSRRSKSSRKSDEDGVSSRSRTRGVRSRDRVKSRGSDRERSRREGRHER